MPITLLGAQGAHKLLSNLTTKSGVPTLIICCNGSQNLEKYFIYIVTKDTTQRQHMEEVRRASYGLEGGRAAVTSQVCQSAFFFFFYLIINVPPK